MSLQKFFIGVSDTPHDPRIYFCNLRASANVDNDAIAVGNLEYIRNLEPNLIAHDVLDHSAKHRIRSYVPWTEELRAFGKAHAYRGMDIDVSNDFDSALEYILVNPTVVIPPVPHLWFKQCRENPIGLEDTIDAKHFAEFGLKEITEETESLFLRVRDHVNLGYLHAVAFNCSYMEDTFYYLRDALENFYYSSDVRRQYFVYDTDRYELTPTRTFYAY